MKTYTLFVTETECVPGFSYNYESFVKCLYTLLSSCLFDNTKLKVIKDEIIVVDILNVIVEKVQCENKLYIYSKYKNIKYDINTCEGLCDFIYLYTETIPVEIDVLRSLQWLISKITVMQNEMFEKISKNDDKNNDKYNCTDYSKNKETVAEYNLKHALDKLSGLESKLLSKQLITKESTNTLKPTVQESEDPLKPTFGKVFNIDKYKLDTETTDSSSYTESELSNSDLEDFYGEYTKIHEMEKTKEKIKSIISNVEKSIDKEDYDLAIYAGEVDKERILSEKEKAKEMDKYNQFISQKTFTYKSIYNDFFIAKKIPTWDDIPSLFSANFAIFLFMDGKDHDGNQVREKLLDTEDEYRIYKLLLLALTDDTFEMPDDDKDVNLITDFLDSLPPMNLLSADKIMTAYNDPENDLFENDETSLNSNDGDEPKKGNETYS
jgi:hypothetical protein